MLWLKICITTTILVLFFKPFIDKKMEYNDGSVMKLVAILGQILSVVAFVAIFLALWYPE